VKKRKEILQKKKKNLTAAPKGERRDTLKRLSRGDEGVLLEEDEIVTGPRKRFFLSWRGWGWIRNLTQQEKKSRS